MAKKTITRALLRLEVDAASKANFRDALTNQEPRIWKGNVLQIDVALCAALANFVLSTDDQLVDVTAWGLESLTIEVKDKADPSHPNLMAKTVSVFDNSLTAATWNDGTGQHATFLFSDAEANIGAGVLFVVVSGITSAGPFTFGLSTFTVSEDGTPGDAPDPETNPGSAISLDQADARYALLTVATKYRVKTDGTFQLWNADQSKWHALTVSGTAGAEVLNIGAGES